MLFEVFQQLHLNTQTILVLAGIFLLIVKMKQVFQRRKLPPGPTGFPVLGVMPKLGKKPYLRIQEWWQKYGDVFSMYMGSRLVVVVNGLEVMKECYIKKGDTFNGRPWNYFKKITKNTGIVFTEGVVWKEHRRFTLTCLRDFGMGKVCLEEKITEESQYLIREFQSENGKPFDVRKHLPKAVSNIICSIIYGSRFDYTDTIFRANIDALDQSVRKQSLMGMINFLPFLEFLPSILPKDKLLTKNVKMRDDYAAQQVEEHMGTFDATNPRDYIDAYLARMTERQRKELPTTFAEKHLKRSIQDLFIAGTETVNTTLKWAFLLMIMHPKIQARVQQEIDDVIGSGRRPRMSDKPQMPYTEATLMECQRVGNIALFSVPRCALDDATLGGYDVPKGTWIFVNRWGLHRSEKYWKNATEFKPERFLDMEGHRVVYPDAFVPFGVGPRNCLGEGLAKMELFLFFTSILQVFTLHLPEGANSPSLEPVAGINMCPQPYQIQAITR